MKVKNTNFSCIHCTNSDKGWREIKNFIFHQAAIKRNTKLENTNTLYTVKIKIKSQELSNLFYPIQ